VNFKTFIASKLIKFSWYLVAAFGMDQEIPDYDMDSEDEVWLTKQVIPPIVIVNYW
jgi:hypothetical protein